MDAYREKGLKRKIKIHELQIAKHRKRIARAQEKICICNNELEEIENEEEILKNLGDGNYLSDFDAKKLKGESPNDGSAEHVKDYLNDLKGG